MHELSHHSLPKVGVLPTKFQKGANNISDSCPPLILKPFIEAFTIPWNTDAHFVQYATLNTGNPEYPRCNKPLLEKLRIQGADILTTMLVLDYDNPGHKPWQSKQQIGTWLESLANLVDDWPMAWQWSFLYTTRNGARLVYVLDNPIPADQAELKHLWLCQEFSKRGMAIDEACGDWTRCFRLPYVVRDGEPTWEAEIFETLMQLDNRLASDTIPNGILSKRATLYGNIEPIQKDQPDDITVMDLIRTGTRQTEFFKEAKKRLRGRDCFPCLFKHEKLAERGGRDDALHQYVGQAISLLYYLQGTTMEHIYALFLDATLQLEPDAGTPDWREVLWSAICRLWAKELAKSEAEQQEAQRQAGQAKELFQEVLNGMREWCNAPELRQSDEQALAWAIRRMVVSCGSNFYVIGPDGYYDPMQVSTTQLIARLRIIGLDGIVETKTISQNGAISDAPLQSIINNYATIVREIRAIPSIEGAFIDNIDTPYATMVVPCFKRNENLVPEYNSDVDEWLSKLFGSDFEWATRWIGWALAFEEGPICALSIMGKQGSGKKMLAQGLGECLQMPMLADSNDLVGEYQYGLLDSPFLVINEGWPTTRGGMHPADKFRSLVSGDSIRISRKYKDPISIRNPARILFTANNMDVVRMLSASRDLSPEDREALSIRLTHIKLTDEASDWLRLKGGVQFTKGWIAGDGGEPSKFTVAKHFLWLYQNRKGPCGKRLLMEGNNNTELMFDMRTQSGSSPLVIETIIHLIEGIGKRDGLAIEEGKVFILVTEVLSHFRNQVGQNTREKLTSMQISKVMKGVVKSEPSCAFELKARKDLGRRRWHELDLLLLQSVAQRDGWACPKLDALVKEQEARKNGTYIAPDPKSVRDQEGLEGVPKKAAIIDFSQSVRNLQSMPS